MLAFQLVDRLRQLSPAAANATLTLFLPQIIPLAGGLGLTVKEVSDERSEIALPLKRRTRNHVGSIYFGAQMTAMELTMGLLVFKRFPPGPYGMLVKRVEADFHQKAKDGSRAVCEPGRELLERLTAALQDKGAKAEEWIGVKLLAADGSLVTEARFLAALKKF